MVHIDTHLLMSKAKEIRLLLLDVDGVLTDGSIVYTAQGEQVQAFHVQDGLGLKLLQRAGVETAIISSRTSKPLVLRAAELGIARVYQGHLHKSAAYEQIAGELGIEDRQVAYVGDDWVDLPLLQRVGLAVVVADSAPPIADYAHYVTRRPGGRGAVREVCDMILKAQNHWSPLLNQFLNPGADDRGAGC